MPIKIFDQSEQWNRQFWYFRWNSIEPDGIAFVWPVRLFTINDHWLCKPAVQCNTWIRCYIWGNASANKVPLSVEQSRREKSARDFSKELQVNSVWWTQVRLCKGFPSCHSSYWVMKNWWSRREVLWCSYMGRDRAKIRHYRISNDMVCGQSRVNLWCLQKNQVNPP